MGVEFGALELAQGLGAPTRLASIKVENLTLVPPHVLTAALVFQDALLSITSGAMSDSCHTAVRCI